MKKIIILVFMCLFCVGCQAKYQITINDDLTVNEDITGLEDESFYDNYYKSTKERVISFMTETKDEYLNEIGYSKQIVSYGDLTGALFSHKFSSIEEYFEKSEAYTQFYDKWHHEIKDGVVTISLENQLLRNEDSIERYVIDECEVSITLPFKVKKSNADSVNKNTNTYTWNLTDDESKDIYIKFDTNKIATNKENKYIDYLIIGVIFIVIGFVITVIYKKSKLNNSID